MKTPAFTLVDSPTIVAMTNYVRCTRHAQIRQQQRGIGICVLGCLLAYGRRQYNHDRCEIVYFDSQALERIEMHEGTVLAHLAREHRDIYAVVDCDGCVVTTGHRFKRIQRDRSLVNLRPRRRK